MPQEAAEEADDGEVPVEEPAKKRRRRKNEASPHEAQLTEAGKPAGALVFEKCTGIGTCGKSKPQTEFNTDQNSCKNCTLHVTPFWRHAEKQKKTKELRDLQKSDNKADQKLFADMMKAFIKERLRAAREQNKIKFCMQSFKVSLQSSSGERAEAQRETMWEGEWMEAAKNRQVRVFNQRRGGVPVARVAHRPCNQKGFARPPLLHTGSG